MLPDQVEGAGGTGLLREARPRMRGIFHRQPGHGAAVRAAVRALGNELHRNLADKAIARLRFDGVAAVAGSATEKREQRHGAIRHGVIVDVAADIHDGAIRSRQQLGRSEMLFSRARDHDQCRLICVRRFGPAQARQQLCRQYRKDA
jgi:hypothetical protein